MRAQPANVGEALRTLRGLAGLTLEETAVIADTSVAYLSKVETGKYSPSKGYVAQITSALAAHIREAA